MNHKAVDRQTRVRWGPEDLPPASAGAALNDVTTTEYDEGSPHLNKGRGGKMTDYLPVRERPCKRKKAGTPRTICDQTVAQT